jgi:hypothetical protein
METLILHVQLNNNFLIALLKLLLRSVVPVIKPEEIRFNLKQAAIYVGESEKSLIRHAELGLVEVFMFLH